MLTMLTRTLMTVVLASTISQIENHEATPRLHDPREPEAKQLEDDDLALRLDPIAHGGVLTAEVSFEGSVRNTPHFAHKSPQGVESSQTRKSTLMRREAEDVPMVPEVFHTCPTFAELQAAAARAAEVQTGDGADKAAGVAAHLAQQSAFSENTAIYAVRNGTLLRRFNRFFKQRQEDDDGKMDTYVVEAAIMKSLARFGGEFPDGELLLVYGDGRTSYDYVPSGLPFPIFVFSPLRSDVVQLRALGFPNPYFLCGQKAFSQESGWHSSELSWNERAGAAMFRGALTVGEDTHNHSQLVRNIRLKLFEITKTRPDLFDVAFTDLDDATLPQAMAEEADQLYTSLTHGEPVDMTTFAPQFKYNLNVEGQAASWRGSQLLASGSTMLLQDSWTGEFFDRDLEAWKHYVPIKHDLSDLVETLDYLKIHDEKAAEIGRNGLQFSNSHLGSFGTDCYIAQSFLLAATQFPELVPRNLTEADLLINHGFEHAPPQLDNACDLSVESLLEKWLNF